MYQTRLKKLQILLKAKNLSGLLVTNPYNIFYLTGFKGVSDSEREVTALIDKTGLTLFSPRLYQEEVKSLSKRFKYNIQIIKARHELVESSKSFFAKVSRIGIEAKNLTLFEYIKLKKEIDTKLIVTEDIIENLRVIKDNNEIEYVKQAVKITDLAFQAIKKAIKPGLTETQIAKKLIEEMEKYGADGLAFEPIVASGKNSALPHYSTTNNIITQGIILIDAGASYKGYKGDLTRTFYLGIPDSKFVKTYELLLSVQEIILKNIKPGMTGEETWKLTNALMDKESKYFLHGLGHGVGLEIHEAPYLRKGMQKKLSPGMTITIEPGLYYPGWGGIRIEDYIIVNESGCHVLSKTPKRLEDIII